MESSWLIGSIDLPLSEFTVDASAQSIPLGTYYLYHPSDALSLLDLLAADLAAAGIVLAAVVLTRGRRVKLVGNANFSVTWGSATVLRDILGFTGDLSGSPVYTAPNESALLWSPGKVELSREAPMGIAGHRKWNAYFSQSPRDATTSVVIHGSIVSNTFFWPMIPTARYQVDGAPGGTWEKFWDQVVVQGMRFHLWRAIDELDGSTTAVTWTSSLGPYCLRLGGRAGPDWTFKRNEKYTWTDFRHDVELAVVQVPELT